MSCPKTCILLWFLVTLALPLSSCARKPEPAPKGYHSVISTMKGGDGEHYMNSLSLFLAPINADEFSLCGYSSALFTGVQTVRVDLKLKEGTRLSDQIATIENAVYHVAIASRVTLQNVVVVNDEGEIVEISTTP